MILNSINLTGDAASSEEGQAFVELMAVIMICTIMGFGIYEAGVLFHNVNVMNNVMELGASHAARGAPWPEVQQVIYDEGTNLMDGAFLEYKLPDAPGNTSNIIVEIWNPRTDEPLVTEYTPNASKFEPRRERIVPYMFWAQGYEIRVGTHLEIGIYVPFIRAFTLSTEIVGSRTIQASNDSDRDGMFDQYESEYGDWYAEEGFGLHDDGDRWKHPVHRDGYGVVDSDSTANVDGDTETEYGGCDLTITTVCKGTTEFCDQTDTGAEKALGIYNPQNQIWTLTRITAAQDGGSVIWKGSFNTAPSESVIVSPDSVLADTQYGNTGMKIDIVVDTSFEIPDNGQQGFKIFDGNGVLCDKVGFKSSSGSLDSQWYETAPYDGTGLSDVEFSRKTVAGGIPIDSNDNSEDFKSIDSLYFPDYRKELPYDYNNNETEDKFDPDDRSGDTENLMRMNHVVGPDDWPDTVP